MRTILLLCLLALPIYAADWPQWRGPARDGISAETGLLKKWPEGGPKLLWKTNKAGNGLSSAAVVGGIVYTMGARGDDEYALAFDGKGQELWATKLGPVHDWKANQWSRGSLATPSVVGDHVYVLTSKGLLACLTTKGEIVWKKDLPTDMKAQVNPVGGGIDDYGWGYAWSPIVDGDQLIITPGGPEGLFAALDRKTGNSIWRSKDIKEQATYASPAVGTIGGVKMAFTVTQKTFYAVNLKDGSLLFKRQRDEDYPDIVCPTPVVVGNKVYFNVGYGGGESQVFEGDGKTFKPVWGEKEVSSKQGGTVIVGKFIYGYHEDRSWMCQDFETGKVVWPTKRMRQTLKAGSVIAADGLLLVQEEEGKVGLLEATSKGYTPLGEFTLPEKSSLRKTSMKVWTHPSLSDGKLYLRDQEWIFCYEVK
ncbi:MAG: polyvinylalcohol dehydrogenase [Planctomycetia bacterium]|nr:polyvinylalcohol dehydrogenase [Planctomycetia bacterium]